jgi:guanosine-3',5'-bis(diphosphate) 3'-pyrophosphohydrolase
MRTIFSARLHMASAENDILIKVTAFADEAHGDQMRRYSNERYIVHPVRVMEMVREYVHDVPTLAAALLHDVLEDTPVTTEELDSFLRAVMNEDQAARTLKLVEELTDVFIKDNYPSLNRRTRRTKEAERLSAVSAGAQTIKYADVIDNVVDIARQDTDFALVYMRENKQLLQQMGGGDGRLYARATQAVDDSLKIYWEKSNIRAL